MPPPPTLAAQSGIDISDELLALYDALKLKKAHKYIIFTLEKTGTAAGKDVFGWNIKERGEASPDEANAEVFKAVVKSLPESEPRFVVFDFTETKSDGRLIKKRAWRRCKDARVGAVLPAVCPLSLPAFTRLPCPTPTLFRGSHSDQVVPRQCELQAQARHWRHVPDAQGEAAGPGQGHSGRRHQRS